MRIAYARVIHATAMNPAGAMPTNRRRYHRSSHLLRPAEAAAVPEVTAHREAQLRQEVRPRVAMERAALTRQLEAALRLEEPVLAIAAALLEEQPQGHLVVIVVLRPRLGGLPVDLLEALVKETSSMIARAWSLAMTGSHGVSQRS